MEEASDNNNNVGDSTTDDESTCVAVQNQNQNQNDNPNSQPESEAVAKGISSTLGTVISDFDSRAQSTLTSQDQLSSSIDRLTRGYFLLGHLSFPQICDLFLPISFHSHAFVALAAIVV
nr:hypothetical protein CFP56_78716 [Quercus suber]